MVHASNSSVNWDSLVMADEPAVGILDCSVLGCYNTTDDGIPLYEFPFHNKRLLATWIKATRRSNWVPVSTSRICDKHFGINDHLSGSRMKPLKKAARPVINNANTVLFSNIFKKFLSSSHGSYDQTNTDMVEKNYQANCNKSVSTKASSSRRRNKNAAPRLNKNNVDKNKMDFIDLTLSEDSEDNVDKNKMDFIDLTLSEDSKDIPTYLSTVEDDQDLDESFRKFLSKKKNTMCSGIVGDWNLNVSLCVPENDKDEDVSLCSPILGDDQDVDMTLCSPVSEDYLSLNSLNLPVLEEMEQVDVSSHSPVPENNQHVNVSMCSPVPLDNQHVYVSMCSPIPQCNVDPEIVELSTGDKKTEINIVRLNFFGLFFVDIPEDNPVLKVRWWLVREISSRFEPVFKICLVYVDPDKFTIHARGGDDLNKITVSRLNGFPNLYLEPKEFSVVLKRCKELNTKGKSAIYEVKKNSSDTLMVQDCNSTDGIFTSFVKTYENYEDQAVDKKRKVASNNNNITFSLNSKKPKIEEQCSKLNGKILAGSAQLNFTKMKLNAETLTTKINDNNNVLKNPVPAVNIQPFIRQYSGPRQHQIAPDISNNAEVAIIKDEDNSKNELTHISNVTITKIASSKKYTSKNQIRLSKKLETLKDKNNNAEVEIIKDEDNSKKRSALISYVTIASSASSNKLTAKNLTMSQNKSVTIKEKNETTTKPNNIGNGKNDNIDVNKLKSEIKEFLLFKEKDLSNNSIQKIPKLLKKSPMEEIPVSITHNDKLTKCFGYILPPYCEYECQLGCYHTISSSDRQKIFQDFRKYYATEQNCIIAKLVRYSFVNTREDHDRLRQLFFLLTNNCLKEVCRTFFINTLGIPESRLNAVMIPANYNWYSNSDRALNTLKPNNKLKIIGEKIEEAEFMRQCEAA